MMDYIVIVKWCDSSHTFLTMRLKKEANKIIKDYRKYKGVKVRLIKL